MNLERMLARLDRDLNALRLEAGLDPANGDWSGMDHISERMDAIREAIHQREKRIRSKRRQQVLALLAYCQSKRPHLNPAA